jgi:CheY-like chemotaxis protein
MSNPRLRVLVVDDDWACLQLMCTFLNAADFEACGQRDPLHAASQLEMERFDGIFLDMKMPVMSGLELALRARNSACNSTTPIVMITGCAEAHVMRDAFAAGAQFFLAKPVDRSKMKRLLNLVQGTMLREKLRHQPAA